MNKNGLISCFGIFWGTSLLLGTVGTTEWLHLENSLDITRSFNHVENMRITSPKKMLLASQRLRGVPATAVFFKALRVKGYQRIKSD